jgi:hypothetical protein
MKNPVRSIALILVVLTPWLPVSAEEQTQGQSSMQAMGEQCGMGSGMMNMSDEQLRAKQDEMLKMHDLMNRINAAKDPAERDRLKEEHLKMMKAHHAKMMQHRQTMMQHGSKMQMHQPSGEKSP